MEGVETAHLRTRQRYLPKARLRLGSTNGDAFPVAPFTLCEFEMFVAVHRCSARVVMSVLDDAGAVLDRSEEAASTQRKGGPAVSSHHRIDLKLVTGPSASFIRIEVVQLPEFGPVDAKDRFVFLSKPSLKFSQLEEGRGPSAIWCVHNDSLHFAATGLPAGNAQLKIDTEVIPVNSSDGRAYCVRSVPGRLRDGRMHSLSLWIDDKEIWCDWFTAPIGIDGGAWSRRLNESAKIIKRQKSDLAAAQARIAELELARSSTSPRSSLSGLIKGLNGAVGRIRSGFASNMAPDRQLADSQTSINAFEYKPARIQDNIAYKPTDAEEGEVFSEQISDNTRPTVNWVIGPKDNEGWAYGNNAKRIASRLGSWKHLLSSEVEADIVLYFDALVAERYPSPGKIQILRVGGDRPLDRRFGSDVDKLRAGLEHFDAVIVLSPALYRRVSPHHPNVVFIPNGLDLSQWHPEALRSKEDPRFVVGYAASAQTPKERAVKGLDLAIAACEQLQVPLKRVHKGDGQVAHGQMISDFYSEIDALIHPVGPGREGTSNVILEAISLGLPVITTRDAGFHGQRLSDGVDALIAERSVDGLSEKVRQLMRDEKLRASLSKNARAFAERHHDIRDVARLYDDLFRQALVRARQTAMPRIGFHPFWKPEHQYASSRIRSQLVKELLEAAPAVADAKNDDAEIEFVIQSADDGLVDRLRQRPNCSVIYDVCDRYYEDERLFKTQDGTISSLDRFNDLVSIADVVITPTANLKAEISRRFERVPVYVIPEIRDYTGHSKPPVPFCRRVLWFGSAQRGNFSSAEPILRHLHSLGYHIHVVTNLKMLGHAPEFVDTLEEWTPAGLAAALEISGLAVVSHSNEEFTKSSNRFVTAVTAGLPTIVSSSPEAADLLRDAGCEYAIARSPADLDAIMLKLSDDRHRAAYIEAVQNAIALKHGNHAVRQAYSDLITQRLPRKQRAHSLRVAFVTHNLNLGEGAPRSLLELSAGLRDHCDIEPFIYCAGDGPLRSAYEELGIPVHVFSDDAKNPTKVLDKSLVRVRRNFKRFLADKKIDFVVANTIKSAPYVKFAQDIGLDAALIIRESYDRSRRYDYFSEEASAAAQQGLLAARSVIFVSDKTSELWRDEAMATNVRVIKNGISPDRFRSRLSASREACRREAGIKTPLAAVCVGTVGTRKGQAELVQWFSRLTPDVRRNLTLLFVGATDGKQFDYFMSQIGALDPDTRANVLVVPATSDVGLYYRASDFLLLNSMQESYPRSVMEGLCFGLPAISTPVYGVKEQVRDGVNGLLYNFNDEAGWHAHMTRIVLDQTFRANLSTEAERSFWKLTTYAEMLNDYHSQISPRASLRQPSDAALRSGRVVGTSMPGLNLS